MTEEMIPTNLMTERRKTWISKHIPIVFALGDFSELTGGKLRKPSKFKHLPDKGVGWNF